MGNFKCRRCGNCCQIPGVVRVGEREIERIADFLDLDVSEFIETYTRLADEKNGLVLLDAKADRCVFLDSRNQCLINPVKPDQCRGFPHQWNYPGFKEVCSAFSSEQNE